MWTPSTDAVGTDFVPYGTNGQWVSTDEGWYWQSGYSWGWLPFHYGRWVQRTGSWAWVPGRLFAPAWVDWRMNDAYAAMGAPLPPEGMIIDAPYAFCGIGMLGMPGFWSQVIYGPAAAGIYATSHGVPATYGMGGAHYSWGPQGQGARAGHRASGWERVATTEVGARAGTPVLGASGGGGARPVGAGAQVAMRPNAPGPIPPTSLGSRQVPPAGITPIQSNPRYATPAEAYRSQPTYAAPATAYRPQQSYATPATGLSSTAKLRGARDRCTVRSPLTTRPPRTRPAYSAPSYSTPSYSAPAYHPSYSAPAYHSTYSAPAYHPSYSAPAYHASGGGGGGYRGGRR